MTARLLLPTQAITTKGDLPSPALVEIIQRLVAVAGTGGGGSVAWGDLTGVPATFPPSAHTLDAHADPVASVEFAQQQALQFVVENRTSDPGSPVAGQLWLRTDL